MFRNRLIGNGYLELEGVLAPLLQGEHDLVLDGVRSLLPFLRLTIMAKPLVQSSRLLMVAEVDDAEQRETHVVFCTGANDQHGCARKIDAPLFRMSDSYDKKWRAFDGPEVSVGKTSHLVLDGNALLKDKRYEFRRWAYMRIQGPWQLHQVELLRGSSI